MADVNPPGQPEVEENDYPGALGTGSLGGDVGLSEGRGGSPGCEEVCGSTGEGQEDRSLSSYPKDSEDTTWGTGTGKGLHLLCEWPEDPWLERESSVSTGKVAMMLKGQVKVSLAPWGLVQIRHAQVLVTGGASLTPALTCLLGSSPGCPDRRGGCLRPEVLRSRVQLGKSRSYYLGAKSKLTSQSDGWDPSRVSS